MRQPADQLSFDLVGGPADAPVVDADVTDDDLRPEQRAVVELASDFVVTAGAGSGKTRTLVALYSAILADPALTRSAEPIGPQRILCLTFTERAARELLRKVRDRTTDPRWRRELESAPISTFHGWCAELLRRYPIEAGVDPRFTVLSEEAAEEMLRTAALDSLRGGLERGDEAARQAIELVGLGLAAQTMTELVIAIRTAGWPTRRPIERFEERIGEAELRLRQLAAEVEVAAGDLLDAGRGGALNTPVQRAALDRIEAAWSEWKRDRSVAAAVDLAAAAKSAGKSWRFYGNKQLREAVFTLASSWAALAREVENRLQLGIWPALSVTVRETYRRERWARAALDYDDLLLRTRDLLRHNAEVRDEVRGRYRAVLIDEHQDTDPVQDEILRILIGANAIAGHPADGDPRWCVVGDAKQSIYGFRGATVAAFEKLSREAHARGARRDLATNYRSRAELVAFHNAFFPAVLVPGPGGDRPMYSMQVANREAGEGPAVELLSPPDERRNAEGAREEEAMALAARIAAACGAGEDRISVVDEESGEERPARPGDVVILLRRLTQVEPYRRALDLVGLESVVVGSGSFWARQETFDILNALDAALRPQDPIPLVGFLRSPMAGLADDAIWRLVRGWDRRLPLRRHVADAERARELDPEESVRLADALAVLDGIRSRADFEPPGAIVGWLVDRTGYASVLDALPDRAQRRANVERLIALADRAPVEGHALLSQWAAALRRRADRPPRDRDASLPEVGDRIRILTIHQAKGLEFPIVALGDIGGKVQRGPGGVRFDPDLGVVAKVWIDSAEKPLDTGAYALARDSAREREEAEEARLLYVAATRARDRLVLSSGATGASWLAAVEAFAATPEARGLLTVEPLGRWSDRFRASVGQTPPLGDPGIAVRSPAPAAPGEAAARELAAALAGEPPAPAPVAAAREAAALALERGARGHAALERIPLAPVPADVAAWLAGPGGLPASEAAGLAAYWEREVRPQLEPAAEVERERPFRLRLPGGGVVVGTIDALWREEAGGWRVGDYKFTGADGESDARHEAQLAIYALAASAVLGLDEIGGLLWYVDRGARAELRWSAADLRALESELDAAFGRLGPVDTETAATAVSS
ncbi:MAG TPA: UvrD-helicase domain-containing protein [Gemmatimonadota bacterium]|nr:UvrD-helicase domain-containing protein [Gemmatimonadota bacterium]